MTTEVIKRTFEAEKHPKGSPERAKLNEEGLTSEYMHSQKYTAFIHIPANETHLQITHHRSFATKGQAEQWIIDNANRMEQDHNLTIREYQNKYPD
jgi:hypothetical protein